MSTITTHVLDTALGKPAAGISVTFEIENDSNWKPLAKGTTDSDGRVKNLIGEVKAGT